ncbi:tripartite motif-containing protein 75-like [Erinaceus europaeus]|uniref:Tripartite motif-containing protein 75-like n=1 Tax=Erinaceus europaeus TaxID=9365 RepID=A0ABM3WF35_ERIEU|nr:tripartite motif-containing protein 75-like [Erinaceus europaeus]
METSGVSLAMLAEFNCPICLTCMREPITIECGHNFCQSCLQKRWKDPPDSSSCAVCRHLCQKGHWITNRKLARMIGNTQFIQTSSNEVRQQEENLCERHNQVLSLFCEEDLEVLCPGCVQAHDQKDHHVRSLEEAASYYRHKVNGSTTLLMEHLAKLEEVEERQYIMFQEVKDQISKQKSELASDLEQLAELVDSDKEAAVSRVTQEKDNNLQRIDKNITYFKDCISTTEALFQEVSKRSVMPDMNILSDAKRIHHQCASLEVPIVCSFQIRRERCSFPPQISALEKIEQKFRAEFWVLKNSMLAAITGRCR